MLWVVTGHVYTVGMSQMTLSFILTGSAELSGAQLYERFFDLINPRYILLSETAPKRRNNIANTRSFNTAHRNQLNALHFSPQNGM